MKRLVLIGLLAGCVTIGLAQTPATFILVRHAEKAVDGTKNPPLSAEGEARAQRLAGFLEKQEIAAVYSTPFTRTQETARPLSEKKSIEIQEYTPSAGAEWLSSLLEKHEGETILIVGHSNTIPTLANHLLDQDTLQQFDESDYTNLLIIVGSKMGAGKLVWLNF